jgi:hypothetical protein
VLSDWVSMSHLPEWMTSLLRQRVAVGNFARCLKGRPLRRVPEVISGPGLASCINRVPDMSREALLDVRLKQNVTDACRGGFGRNISVRVTSYENDGRFDLAASQNVHQFHPGDPGHSVVGSIERFCG